MKSALACVIFSTFLRCSVGTLADQPGTDWLGTPLLLKLDALGSHSARAVKGAHGHWEGEAVQQGAIVVFHANARTGQVTFEKARDNAQYGR